MESVKSTRKINNITTVCGICTAHCGLILSIKDDKIIEVNGQKNHPVSKGYLCPKGKALASIIHAPDRLRHPLKKNKGGSWSEISWDSALDFLADQLKNIKDQYGPQALAVHVGYPGVGREFTSYYNLFCQAFGTPNFSTPGSHCHFSKFLAASVTIGTLPVPDFENSRCIVLWGSNPTVTSPLAANLITKARRNGGKLIVIDPRETFMAKKADLHLQPRPGTDGALALGFIQVILKKKLYDSNFVNNWIIGLDYLVEYLKIYPLEKIEKITGIPQRKIEKAAKLYGSNSPACISPGIALELQSNGFQGLRAIYLLQSLCGNLDIRGGSLFPQPNPLASLLSELPKKEKPPAVGEKEFPLFYKWFQNAQAGRYIDAILEEKPYSIKAMLIAAGNPMLTWPNSNRVKSALEKLEFVGVIDHFLTETAKQADLVLPAASFLGRSDLFSSNGITGFQKVYPVKKILKEDIPSDWKICHQLMKRLNMEHYFPWNSEEEVINHRLNSLGITFEELCEKGSLEWNYHEKKYIKDGFLTPSGKVEVYCKQLEKLGHDPLPVYKETAESPVSTPELKQDYPLILTTGTRDMPYIHSRFHNIPPLRQLSPEPLLEIHIETAERMALKNNDKVMLESPRGRLQVLIKTSLDILPGVISLSHGWEDANANLLVDDKNLDPVSGFPPCRAFLARIEKIENLDE